MVYQMCPFTGYNPDTEVPDLAGKVILITGGRQPIHHYSEENQSP